MTTVGWAVSKDVVVEKNQTTTVELGGIGTTVKGRLVKPESAADVSLNYGIRLGSVSPEVRVAGARAGQSFRASSDGSFEINDLEPGRYSLSIEVASSDDVPEANAREQSAARASLSFEVPSLAAGRKPTPIDLGTIPLRVTAK